jgi:hypothetical protein
MYHVIKSWGQLVSCICMDSFWFTNIFFNHLLIEMPNATTVHSSFSYYFNDAFQLFNKLNIFKFIADNGFIPFHLFFHAMLLSVYYSLTLLGLLLFLNWIHSLFSSFSLALILSLSFFYHFLSSLSSLYNQLLLFPSLSCDVISICFFLSNHGILT